MKLPSTPVVVREVGLRDGLQSIARVLPTEQKLEWLRAGYEAALAEATPVGCGSWRSKRNASTARRSRASSPAAPLTAASG